jgi:hypothetical protein
MSASAITVCDAAPLRRRDDAQVTLVPMAGRERFRIVQPHTKTREEAGFTATVNVAVDNTALNRRGRA